MAYDYSDSQFVYDGKKYLFNITLHTITSTGEKIQHNLRNTNILQFDYANSLNSLCLEGNLEYQDNFAIIDKYIDAPIAYCSVSISEMIEKVDKSITIDIIDDKHQFSHEFIVNGFKIKKREHHVITYALSLISSSWINCISKITYSNYAVGKEDIIQIVKNLIAKNGLHIDSNSFDNNLCNVKMNYITKRNDNLFSSFQFLMNRLLFFKDTAPSMKFALYNESQHQYQIIDLSQASYMTGESNILLSMFKTSFEYMTSTGPNNATTIVKTPMTSKISSIFSKDMIDYDYSENIFTTNTFDGKMFSHYGNERISLDNTHSKFTSYESTDLNNTTDEVYWNTDMQSYWNWFSTFLETSTLTLETSGNILRKPGYIVNILLDRDEKWLTNDNPSELEELKQKYKYFEGMWVVGKTRHIFFPGSLNTPKPRYRQNLVLFRNFVNT